MQKLLLVLYYSENHATSEIWKVLTNMDFYLLGWGQIRHPGNTHHKRPQAKLSPVSESDSKRKSELLFIAVIKNKYFLKTH